MAKPNVKPIPSDGDIVPKSDVKFPDGTPAGNVPAETLDTFLDEAEALGAAKGAGDDSLATLGQRLVKLAHGADPLVTPQRKNEKLPENDTDNRDHVKEAFARFQSGRRKSAVNKQKDSDDYIKTKVSQLRNFAILGANPNVNGPAIMDTAVEQYEIAFLAATTKEGKARLRDAYTAFLEVAKLQKQSANEKRALSTDQIKGCMTRKVVDTPPLTVAAIWSEIAALATALCNGSRKDSVSDIDPASATLALSIAAHAETVATTEKLNAQIATFVEQGLPDDVIEPLRAALAARVVPVAKPE